MRAGRSVFWLPDQSIRRAFPALFLPARLPSRRRASEKSCRGIGRSLATAGQWPISTVVPGYSDGLAPDLHRLPSTPEAHSHFPLSSPAPHRRSGSPSTVMSSCLCTAPTARPSSGAGRTRRARRASPLPLPVRQRPDSLAPSSGARGDSTPEFSRAKREVWCLGFPTQLRKAGEGNTGIPPRTRRRKGSVSGHEATATLQRGSREGDRMPVTRAGRPAWCVATQGVLATRDSPGSSEPIHHPTELTQFSPNELD